MSAVRRPAVAGLFYPEDPEQLRAQVRYFLDQASNQDIDAPKALIVPHAGYPYSGPVAGTAYTQLKSIATGIERVVLLGPAHRVPLSGVALPEAEAFQSPLGQVPLDGDTCDVLRQLPQVSMNDRAHAMEHSLEVQLPFLQHILPHGFLLTPLLVGDATATQVAAVLNAVWDGSETLIVVSSDLSHYKDYATARSMDQRTSRAIISLDPDGLHPETACGCTGIQGLLAVARQRGLKVHQLDLRNSGDTAGTRDQVVGYGAYAFY